MPEFILEKGGIDDHVTFDALPDLAQGYIEAAFFTGVEGAVPVAAPEPVSHSSGVELPSEFESWEDIEGLGLANLTAESLRNMVADCVRFQIANADALARVCSGDSYDLEAAGRDYWFTRNGHGVGFWDRGLGDDGDLLTAACEYKESSLWAEWIGEGPAEPDDSDGWQVQTEQNSEPLSDAEQLAFLAYGQDGPALSQVGNRGGAPMGRAVYYDKPGEPVTARKVTLDSGGYDAGGAYFGIGEPVYRIIGGDGLALRYMRAQNKAAALNLWHAEHAPEVAL